MPLRRGAGARSTPRTSMPTAARAATSSAAEGGPGPGQVQSQLAQWVELAGVQHAEEQVLGAEPTVAQVPGLLEGGGHGRPGVGGEVFEHLGLTFRACCAPTGGTRRARPRSAPRTTVLAGARHGRRLDLFGQPVQRADRAQPDGRILRAQPRGELGLFHACQSHLTTPGLSIQTDAGVVVRPD